jgi:excisionase family DNA binding protein
MTVDELAEELGMSRKATYLHLANGLLPHHRIGRRYLIPRRAVLAWLDSAAEVANGR